MKTQSTSRVAEFQGVYGPYHVSELLLQKIWSEQMFRVAEARTLDGRVLRIDSPGRWNRLAGPDFRDARLSLDNQEVHGDVEIHFYARDWQYHGHDKNSAYDRVVLHVLLFPPAGDEPPLINRFGEPAAVLVLLPLLWYDLEEYAFDEEASQAAGAFPADSLLQSLRSLEPSEQRTLLVEKARQRWLRKTAFATRRIEQLGWAKASHLSVLEILGYRLNRAPMLRLGEQFPLADWTAGRVSPEMVYQAGRNLWTESGVRPANHPRRRLAQYGEWVRTRPDWPERLRAAAPESARLLSQAGGSFPGDTVRSCRRALGYAQWRSALLQTLGASTLSGTRLATLIGDGFLPLMQAACPEEDLFPLWMVGHPGDVPDHLRRVLRGLEWIGPSGEAACHGWFQGLYSLALEQDLLV